jgi:hypothetical protein
MPILRGPGYEPVFKKFDSIEQHDADDCRQDDGSKRERMALQNGLAVQFQLSALASQCSVPTSLP